MSAFFPRLSKSPIRSPLLGCLYGAISTTYSCFLTFVYALDMYDHPEPGAGIHDAFPVQWVQALGLIWAPASSFSSWALILWVLRVIVLYDPAKRKRWRRYIKVRGIIRALLWAYVVTEAVGWGAVPLYGLQR